MIIELIILFTLKDSCLNIYEIRKSLENNFSLFYKTNIGTLHPALKRLSSKGYLDVVNSISTGGQRKSLYKLTDKGIRFFHDLLTSDIPENPAMAVQFADVFAFVIADKTMDKSVLNKAKENLLRFFELKKLEAGKFSKNNDGLFKYINLYMHNMDEKIKYFSSWDLK